MASSEGRQMAQTRQAAEVEAAKIISFADMRKKLRPDPIPEV
jgi:hypothetical protein